MGAGNLGLHRKFGGGDPPPTLGMVHWKMRDKKSKKATNFFKKTKLKIEFMHFGRHAYAKMMVFFVTLRSCWLKNTEFVEEKIKMPTNDEKSGLRKIRYIKGKSF